MPSLGQRKIVKDKSNIKEYGQYCIDAQFVREVLDLITPDFKINGINIQLSTGMHKKFGNVSNDLKKLGVSRIRVPKADSIDATMYFDAVTKNKILENVKKACENLKVDPANAYVQHIIIDDGECSARFTRALKEIRPDETDQRRKLAVLGLSHYEGNIKGLLSKLNYKRYSCKVEMVEVKTVICSQMR